ncbi:hypothetical protein HYE82_05495 [Streptomyces sp. BR123]|uniref:DUF6507 family protein n=1 Tax=Streptomyces sp. BR123 TaxID=2749828 RepID=UPI0015C460B3|nr:DUF6507 family protein [Streptomyces sp. BR123]NXY93856.1 hypothetical protein [Streptomyces sp. BR123]
MTAWDIKPQGVQGQLKTVGGHAGDLEKALNTLVTAMSKAGEAAGTAVPGSVSKTAIPNPAPGHAPTMKGAMGPVAAALGEYLKGREKELKSMAERIEACILGAVKATNEYLEGDLESAKQAQDAARSVNLEVLRQKPGGGR